MPDFVPDFCFKINLKSVALSLNQSQSYGHGLTVTHTVAKMCACYNFYSIAFHLQ